MITSQSESMRACIISKLLFEFMISNKNGFLGSEHVTISREPKPVENLCMLNQNVYRTIPLYHVLGSIISCEIQTSNKCLSSKNDSLGPHKENMVRDTSQ